MIKKTTESRKRDVLNGVLRKPSRMKEIDSIA